MKNIIINASPRPRGNSKYLASKIIDNFSAEHSFDLIDLPKLKIMPCTACRACKDRDILSYCIIKDDFNLIIDKVILADNIIFITPNHMGFISSYAKIFTDRFYALKNIRKELKFNRATQSNFLFILLQGSSDIIHSNRSLKWAEGFFNRYSFNTKTFLIPACSFDNHDGIDNKFNEVIDIINGFNI